MSRGLEGTYPAVPEPIICAPDDESAIDRMQDEFFLGLVQGLGYVGVNAGVMCRVRSRELMREGDKPLKGNETNDRVTELLVGGLTVASSMKLRTEFNFVQGTFGLYLTPKLEDRVKFRDGDELSELGPL